MNRVDRRLARALCVVLVLVGGCQAGPPPLSPDDAERLNSELIERAFGNFGIEVLSADARRRVSNLYSSESGTRTCRTFAVVLFPERVDPRLAAAHALVVAGGSIGATFAAAGWSIEKRHRYFGEISGVHERARVAALMRLEAAADAAVHVYEFEVSRDGGAPIEYATIAEIHHPDHLRLRDLATLYGPGVQALSVPSATVRPVIDAVLWELEGQGGRPGTAGRAQ